MNTRKILTVIAIALIAIVAWELVPDRFLDLQQRPVGALGSPGRASDHEVAEASPDEPGQASGAVTGSQAGLPGMSHQGVGPVPREDRLAILRSDALQDSGALLDASNWASVCRSIQRLRDSSDDQSRIDSPGWAQVVKTCQSVDEQGFDSLMAEASPIASSALTFPAWARNAATAEEFAERDRRLMDILRRDARAAAAFNAALLYLDYERFSQWAGTLRPGTIHDESSYRRSRIGLDVAWMMACRLGLDCSAGSGFTISECWSTPGCLPGSPARQVVQMRRSPLELALVDAMAQRLLSERVPGG